MKQHKWHKEIKSWADGQQVQYRTKMLAMNELQWTKWEDVGDINSPPAFFSDDDFEYRIKPQPKEPDFDATKYQKALKESGKKFKEKIEQAFAEILDKEVSKLAQPKEPQYLYVYGDDETGKVSIDLMKMSARFGQPYKGKIKLERENEPR